MNVDMTVQKLLEQIRQEAENCNYSKITEVRLRLGCWESIEARDLTEAFGRLKDNGLLESARLIVAKSKTLAKCRYCGNVFEVVYLKNRCKRCGSNYMEFIGDRGVSLEGINGVE
ncbi:MAG: hydrogenase maturation nickel metallochaperone HypA [Bacillota bacterium]|jgi:Zn finger protein HypA/HybF involved in hydrogenase expression|nr:hydrogenase maturation nickel metallochaperone HypA [Bacillota bacterium]MDD3299140.1 hydrogenase maturation nickel metallochaperone HypA [Bacillota bacterium]MDD3850683.1 hydrogenase maturation nickel metallochaperone HypA [Bacillota bacterium]MDD4707926.1 hydrogenase maturation nickel metallochaperone HypA [Bacillota bacterium]